MYHCDEDRIIYEKTRIEIVKTGSSYVIQAPERSFARSADHVSARSISRPGVKASLPTSSMAHCAF